MNVKIDLKSEFHSNMRLKIMNEGIITEGITREDTLVIRYLTYLRKIGYPSQKRHIFESASLHCPSAHRAGLECIKEKLKDGVHFCSP
ncbi:hypothetical protein RI065_10420 [Mycoplasmatota bacterium zrk1]